MLYLVVFLPLFGFLFSAFFGNYFHSKISQVVTSFLLLISSILSWIIFIEIIESNEIYLITLFNWISSGNLIVNWSFRLDSLTAVMFIVVTTVSACVHFYSIGYMDKDKSKNRFMGYLSLFTFFMLILVSSNNLLQLFFGWEGVGLCSYLLIGFWHQKNSANAAAIKAFVVNRVGDFSFLIAIVGVYFVFGSLNFDLIFSQAYLFIDETILFLGFKFSTINLLCFLLFIGAMGKSAQLGFHTWLPDAMEGPTPVSALIHAATMVTAGVFMIARMSPLFQYAEITNIFIIIIGSSTAIFAATIAITQNDIKRVIAYSTCSQLGYMFFVAGLGAYNASIFHLMTHGFFKALLFLCAGSVIYSLHHEQDMRKMGGISKQMPLTTVLMWIGSLAIIGFPFFSGYYSKEFILENAYYSKINIGFFAYIVGSITAFLTAFYSWRLLLLTFHGESRIKENHLIKIKESPKIMIIPLFVLALGSVFSGFFLADTLIGKYNNIFWSGVLSNIEYQYHHLPFIQTFSNKLLVILGISLALIVVIYKKELPIILKTFLRPMYLLSFNKWYIDELYNTIFTKPIFYIAKFFWQKGDIKLIDTYGPNGISKIINTLSKKSSIIQSGFLYHYVFVMFVGLVLFLTWVIL